MNKLKNLKKVNLIIIIIKFKLLELRKKIIKVKKVEMK